VVLADAVRAVLRLVQLRGRPEELREEHVVRRRERDGHAGGRDAQERDLG
jgi:hypothetical protein